MSSSNASPTTVHLEANQRRDPLVDRQRHRGLDFCVFRRELAVLNRNGPKTSPYWRYLAQDPVRGPIETWEPW